MIDYARVAETLKELKEFYTQPLTPDLECWRVHKTLTAAAALCEAHAAPVDETKERAEFEKRASASGYDITHHESGDYVERDTNEACVWWLNRARSDARAKVADAALESIRDEVLSADANVLDNDQVNYVLGIIDAHLPPPTIEGERG